MIPARTRARCGFATAAVIAAVAAFPAASLGASGTTTLALNGLAAKSLRQSGVHLVPLKPAKGAKSRIGLPVRAGLAGASITVLTHGGGISAKLPGGKSLRLTKLRLLLGKRSRVTASAAGEGIDLFRIARGGKRKVDPIAGSVELRDLRLKLTREAARALAVPQKSRKDASGDGDRQVTGVFGTLSSRAAGLTASGDAPGQGKSAAEGSTGCPLPSGAGPAPQDPLPVATRPPGAADVTGATIDWHVRESFIRYIATGEGTSVSGGATADPPVLLDGASTPLTYDFHFPFAGGWHDGGANPGPTDDTAAIYYGGAVRFLYSGHEIDLAVSAPEIEIAGGASRAIFAVAEDGGAGVRQVLVNLDLSRAGAVAVSGNTHVYERVPGAIPSGTATSVFAGFYAPGTEFGCFTVRYTTG